MANENSEKYSSWSIALHWLMLLLIVAVYATMELRGIFPKGSDARAAIKTWHYLLGLSVFILVWARLIARLVYRVPAIRPLPPQWQAYLAQALHIALYALMIIMPLLGWLGLSAEGKPILLFGLQLPALVDENKAFAEQIIEVHESIGTLGYFLIGLHTIAALFHHYWLRDNTLLRMLPRR